MHVPNPFITDRLEIKSIFNYIKADLMVEFSYFLIDYHTKAKEPILPKYLAIAEERSDEIMLQYEAKRKQLPPGFCALWLPIPFPTIITVTLSAYGWMYLFA